MNEVFEPLRAHCGHRKIFLSNCFRSVLLNQELGGADDSQHLADDDEAAVDLDNDAYPDRPQNDELFWCIFNFLDFDQLIWEAGTDKKPGWVHVSYASAETNRKEVLRYIPGEGYSKFDLKP